MNTHPSAQLFIVSRHESEQVVANYLKTVFCRHTACNECTACRTINEKQHHSVLWVKPEKRYTLDLLDGIFKRIEFSLEQNQQYFFVIEKADFLSPACANSLLKIVEEPPPGYHFIFTAQRSQLVLPTIRSRCTLKQFSSPAQLQTNCVFSTHFTKAESNPLTFLTELSKTTLTENESSELVDTFLEFWCEHYKRASQQNNDTQMRYAHSMITLFKNALLTPAMPGSTKIFWRNLFLQKERIGV